MAALFTPFRALGYITDGTSVATQRRGKDTFVTVSVGKAWQVQELPLSGCLDPSTCCGYVLSRGMRGQVYNCAKLLLSLVGPEVSHTCGVNRARIQVSVHQTDRLSTAVPAQHQSTGLQG